MDQNHRNGNSDSGVGSETLLPRKLFGVGREGEGRGEISRARGEGGREETHQARKFIVIFIFISGIFKICTGILAAA